MKDEIKEILIYYQKDIDRYEKSMKNYTEYQQKTTFSKNYQRYKNHKLLLNYITNLQEEKDKQLNKYKNVIDKIKEYCNNRLSYYHEMRIDYMKEFDGYAENDNENILELLEEVE